MKILSFSRKKIILYFVIILIIILCFVFLNENKEIEVSVSDKTEIVQLVTEYYNYLEEENYELAMYSLDNSSTLMDHNTMIRGLYDIHGNILEQFKVFMIHDDIHYSKEYESIIISATINIKYKGTRGGDTKEILLLKWTNNGWRINSIVGIDRYGFYRAPNYDYLRLIGFLDERETQ